MAGSNWQVKDAEFTVESNSPALPTADGKSLVAAHRGTVRDVDGDPQRQLHVHNRTSHISASGFHLQSIFVIVRDEHTVRRELSPDSQQA